MVDLSVKFAGLDLSNLIMVASGPLTRDFIRIKKCVDAGAAAVVTKTILPTACSRTPSKTGYFKRRRNAKHRHLF